MSGWRDLRRELDAWQAAGRTATFWWRDDDAVAPSAALDRLLAIADAMPLALAVVPVGAGRALAGAVAGRDGVAVLVHGLAHQNHAPVGAKKCEFPASRRSADLRADAATALARAGALFGDRALPVLVPPWNRIADTLVPALPDLGYRGLSTYGPRAAGRPAPGLVQANCHLDPIDWRGHRGFRGAGPVLAEAIDHLAGRRSGRLDASEPVGLLTHHLVHDAETWSFLEVFLGETMAHPATRWLSGVEVFAGGMEP